MSFILSQKPGFFCLVKTVLILAALVLCSSSNVLASNKKTVALVMKALTNPFFSQMELGAKGYAQQHQIPLEVFGVERETDIERQISIMEDLIARGYGAIVIAPADSKKLIPVCQKALAEGIVVINVDNPLHRETLTKSGVTIPFVGPDNLAGAEKIGDYIKFKLGGMGRVIIIEGIRGVENAELRKKGFIDAVTRNSSIKIAASESANWHTDEALSLTNRLLQSSGAIDAIFCANDKMALGVLQALDIAGLTGKILLAGYDNIEAVRYEMQNKHIHCTVEQHPEIMGAIGVKLAMNSMKGEKPPQFTATPVDLITHDSFNKSITLFISSLENPFFASLTHHARQTAELHGLNLKVYNAENDDAKQLTEFMNLQTTEVNGFIINPANTETVGLGIELANQKNIPVITVDRKAAEGNVISHIASDNVEGGIIAAKTMARHLGGKGNVLELEGIPGTSASQERGRGFNDGLAEFPEIKIISREVAHFDREKGASIVRHLLNENLKFNGIFAHNDNMILGAMDALAEKNLLGTKVLIGFDGIEDARKAVAEGNLTATVVQQPDKMGILAVESMIQVFRGATLNPEILVNLDVIEK